MRLPSHSFGSWLFVPGDDPKKLNKVLESDADVVIIDPEDAVAPGRKDIARSLTLDALSKPSRPARYVWVNDLTSGRTLNRVFLQSCRCLKMTVSSPNQPILQHCQMSALETGPGMSTYFDFSRWHLPPLREPKRPHEFPGIKDDVDRDDVAGRWRNFVSHRNRWKFREMYC